MYGSEYWVPKKRIVSRIQSAEMRFLRGHKGCTRIRNELISEELQAEAIGNNMREFRRKRYDHVDWIEKARLPK